jgi:arylsulfatase A-like enzyme
VRVARAWRGAALALLLLAGLLVLVAPPGCRRQPAPATPPNLILLTVDTLRADRLGCYGYSRDTSPELDRLAAEGTLFEAAYAQRGSTWPSLTSILTSQHPVTHGVRENGMPLGDGPETLAEALAGRGYSTYAVLTNSYQQAWRGFETVVPAEEKPQDQVAADRAIDWLRAGAVEPFFLWVHMVAPHDPYAPPAGHDRFGDPGYSGGVDGGSIATTRIMFGLNSPQPADLSRVQSLYDGEVAFSDTMIARVLGALEERSFLDRSLVVATSDHGEELLDHHDYFFHHASVYEGVLHIPLILWQPGVVPAGRREGSVVQSIDIAPTVLELLDVPVPTGFDGRSLAPLLRGEALPAEPAFAELKDQILTVRTGDHRYVFNPSGVQPPRVPGMQLELAGAADLEHLNRVPIGVEELYDLSADPKEQTDLAPGHPAVLDELRELIAGFQRDQGWTCGEEVDRQALEGIDPETRRQLEAMGYVIGPAPGPRGPDNAPPGSGDQRPSPAP